MEPPLDGALRDAQHRGDLVDRAALPVVQDQDGPQRECEAFEGTLQLIEARRFVGDSRPAAGRLVRFGDEADRDLVDGRAPASAPGGPAGVEVDAAEPGVESLRIAQLADVAPGVEEGVLGGIARVGLAPEDREGGPEGGLDPAVHEPLEGDPVALARPPDEVDPGRGCGPATAAGTTPIGERAHGSSRTEATPESPAVIVVGSSVTVLRPTAASPRPGALTDSDARRVAEVGSRVESVAADDRAPPRRAWAVPGVALSAAAPRRAPDPNLGSGPGVEFSRREAATRGPHHGRRDRAEPLARPTRRGIAASQEVLGMARRSIALAVGLLLVLALAPRGAAARERGTDRPIWSNYESGEVYFDLVGVPGVNSCQVLAVSDSYGTMSHLGQVRIHWEHCSPVTLPVYTNEHFTITAASGDTLVGTYY